MPEWLRGDVLDVRKTVNYYLALQEAGASAVAMRQQQHIVFHKVSMGSKNYFPLSSTFCTLRRALSRTVPYTIHF